MQAFMEYDFNIEKVRLACFVPKGKGEMIHKNRPSHGLALNLEGMKQYDFGEKSLMVGQGDIIYLPKGSNYTVYNRKPGECYAINFDISEQMGWEPFVFHINSTRQMLDPFREAERSWKEKQRGYQMKCKELLYHILLRLQKEYHRGYMQTGKRDMIAPAVACIHESYTSRLLSISELAEMCGITPEYFRAIFQRFYGTSPLKYINTLKLSHAKELIQSGLYSVTEAAELSGYTDPSYFSREFKKHFGVPPTVYKK